MPNPRPILERFHEKYEKVPFSGCWIWTHAKMAKGGYGRITFKQGSQVGVGAHRVSWELHNGPIPNGMWVLHRCDVPACVNPDHLFLGNASDNALDAVSKGRHNNGRKKFMETFCGPICPRWVRSKRKSDKKRKGAENQKGSNNHNAKLDWEKVRDIRTRRMNMAAFARLYGVSHKTIRNITYGVKWIEDSPP